MQKWIEEHFFWVLLGGTTTAFAILRWGKTVVSVWRGWMDAGRRIEERRDHLIHVTEQDAATWERACEKLTQEKKELERQLREKVRDCDVRDDINAQDRLEIRLLRERLRARHIEYDDILETVSKWTPSPR